MKKRIENLEEKTYKNDTSKTQTLEAILENNKYKTKDGKVLEKDKKNNLYYENGTKFYDATIPSNIILLIKTLTDNGENILVEDQIDIRVKNTLIEFDHKYG